MTCLMCWIACGVTEEKQLGAESEKMIGILQTLSEEGLQGETSNRSWHRMADRAGKVAGFVFARLLARPALREGPEMVAWPTEEVK